MATSIYDPSLWDTLTPANVLGGHRRMIKAVRDRLGRFMPDDEVGRELWTLDPEHGRAGGVAILQKKGKNYFRELAKKRWIKAKERG